MAKNEAKRDEVVEVALSHSRWKNFLWGAGGIGLGIFLAINMGSIGWVLAAMVWAGSITNVKEFVQTFLSPPGAIVIRDGEVELPRGLCAGASVKVPLAELTHSYLLRRAIPWNTAGPVLVIETRRGVFEYPRNWFPVDGDQRLVSSTLNRRMGTSG